MDESVFVDQVRAAMLAISQWHRTPGVVDKRWSNETWRERACGMLQTAERCLKQSVLVGTTSTLAQVD